MRLSLLGGSVVHILCTMGEPSHGLRYFSGDDNVDWREYKRWKQWAMNKMAVMDKLPKEARGSFIWTLLQGRALEVVEHLEPSEYQKEGGDQVLFGLLDTRWPERERTDEIGENLTEIFSLRAKDGEQLRTWCARARECFDRCQRKTGVKFPEEAKGWILLNYSGLSEEQRAVVLARTSGDLKMEVQSQAMRSCFPELVVSRKKASSVHYVERSDDQWWYEDDYDGISYDQDGHEMDDPSFNDVEMFLADHDKLDPEPEHAEVFLEDEVADVLATTWKDKRQELQRLQKARRFPQAAEAKRSFRVEIEELKRRTQCRRCGKTGHWARECKVKLPSGGLTSSSSSTTPAAANLVQHFVCHAVTAQEAHFGMIKELQRRKGLRGHDILLVSSPGFAILDSGCGKSVIGENTLRAFRGLWKEAGVQQPKAVAETNVFRFGNGAQETSEAVIELPVSLAGRRGLVRAAVIRGNAPLLLSRPALKTLNAKMDFQNDEIHLFDDNKVVPMVTNEAGQYTIPVADFGPPTESELKKSSENPDSEMQVNGMAEVQQLSDNWEMDPDGLTLIRHHRVPRKHAFTPCHEGCPVPIECLSDSRASKSVSADGQFVNEVWDNWRDPSCAHQTVDANSWVGQTVFQVRPPPELPEPSVRQWKPKQRRQVRACALLAEHALEKPQPTPKESTYKVIEVFSPPRFALECTTRGVQCLSADLTTGWDFRSPNDRAAMRDLVQSEPPELLVLCPPCTWAGGWYELNKMYLSEEERSQRDSLTKLFLNFCADLAEIQIAAGKRVVFEHPKRSRAWKLPKFQALASKMYQVDLDMCCYGLRVPDGLLIHKSTRLLVSHQNMCVLARRCPGDRHPNHRVHQVIQGNTTQGQLVSRLAGIYPRGFVLAVLRTCRAELSKFESLLVQAVPDRDCFVAATVRELNEQKKAQMTASLRKLHANLGHPNNSALIRVLKNGGANQQALELARDFTCPVCEAQKKPSPAHPAQTHRVTEFNKRVGLDVKYLPGWLPNQKFPALNVIDYASSFQMVIPLPGKRETAESLRRAFQERWVSWAGQPSELVLDPAQTNLSDAFTVPQELAGSIVHSTAAEAHWQLGKVEVHGGWFARVLTKVIEDCTPNTYEGWLECVVGAHSKNELIQVYGMTPPQFVFGRNPRIPQDLLNEPLDLVPATASLYEDGVARTVAVRQAARKAVLELQDDKALRTSLAARPRKLVVFQPGDAVAYWRTQKSVQGVIERGGRWYGPAIVLGYVGQNLVVIHKKQIFRCAPEQVRHATSEERTLLDTPRLELLGIKDLIQQGQLSRQYIDVVPDGPPPPASDPEQSVREPPAQAPKPMDQDQMPIPNAVQPPPAETQADADSFQPQLSADRVHTKSPSGNSQPYPVGVPSPEPVSTESSSEYGPMRRVSKKTRPELLFRPKAMLEEDFLEMMQEVVPRLLDTALESEQVSRSSASDSVPSRGTKREASREPEESTDSKRRAEGSPGSTVAESSEPPSLSGMSLLEFESLLLQCDSTDQLKHYEMLFMQCDRNELCVETLVAAHINKRAAKELPVSGNPLELQNLVDEAKSVEWHTVLSRNAVRVVQGREAQLVRQRFSNRIMGSRFVMTVKQEEDSPARVKGRWCLQGHLDPDLSKKAAAGDLQSPTLSQVGRSVLFQTIASHKWRLRLGDIKGAFLASGELPQQYRPLYASLLQGGIPGVPPDALIEVIGHIYGLNDSPSAWSKCLDKALRAAGFIRSKFDPCLYQLRDASGKLVGIYGVHVDDCATGGEGELYEKALAQLKRVFEFRKWRLDDGEFCGARYTQDPVSFAITMSQDKFCDKLRPLRLSKSRQAQKFDPLTQEEIRCLRAINGGLNWLATQSRPDLSTQVSFSQQSFPEPTVADALAANNAVRRAKQHSALPIVFQPITPLELSVMCHSDAAYANGREGSTQAGYLLSFTSKHINDGQLCAWTPAYWRSQRLPRVVNSTLSAEAQSMNAATGMLEWIMLLLSEILDGPQALRASWVSPPERSSTALTDCKSLFDHLVSKSSPTLDDKRTALDVVIIRESLQRLGTHLRWIPTDRMIADALTKESIEAMDLIRACLKSGHYQISDEDHVLEWRAAERQLRKSRLQ